MDPGSLVGVVWIEDGRYATRALAGGSGMLLNAEAPGFLPRDLGGGLVLRQATADDTEAAAEFQAQVHLPHTFAESFRIWTRDLMSGALPGFQPGDFTLVEDTGTGDIVSILNLIPQTWSYGGVEISVGRIELVSTHPDYRRRGLVRAQMDAVHEMSARRGEKMQVISGIPWELKDGASWLEVTPSVVRYLQRMGGAYTARRMRHAFSSVAFELGTEHPAYQGMNDRSPRSKRVRAWYVRVPDIAGFLRHVTPVLERRVAGSAVAGCSGTLTIGFVDYGVDLSFDSGRLTKVETLARPRKGGSWLNSGTCDAFFPGLVFLQILFGFRAAGEIEYAVPDCDIGSPETRRLLGALFPKQPSYVWGVW